jgi:hypothetical protein
LDIAVLSRPVQGVAALPATFLAAEKSGRCFPNFQANYFSKVTVKNNLPILKS